MRKIIAKAGEELRLGKRGEKNAVCVLFDISHWIYEYGSGTVNLIYQRNGDAHPYPCVIDTKDGEVRWIITNTETAKAGRGKAELQLTKSGLVVKSETFTTRVIQSLSPPSETAPAAGQAWLDKILENATDGGGGGGGSGGGGSGGGSGEDGGYYVPYVDDGMLSWAASKSGMPDVASSYIKGEKGDKGNTGATGVAGKTPERGVDYWTETDKQSVVQEVVAQIDPAIKSMTVTETDTNAAIVCTLEDGSVDTIVLSFDSDNTVFGMTVNGVSIPVDWTVS